MYQNTTIHDWTLYDTKDKNIFKAWKKKQDPT